MDIQTGGFFSEGERMFIGALIGGVAGAAAIFFLAVRSMNRTREEIRIKSLEWKNRAAGFVRETPFRHNPRAGKRTAGNMTVHIAE